MGKKYETFLDIAEEHEVKLYALKRVCDTRFAQSEHRVYENFIRKYKVLREALRKKSKDKKGQTKQERKRLERKNAIAFQRCAKTAWKNYWIMGEVICLIPLLVKCMIKEKLPLLSHLTTSSLNSWHPRAHPARPILISG
eukprot:scaffold225824_cov18-Prasinocladus_malaysianus.AAC.1